MLKELIQSEMAWVGGGMGCSCCCKRNPPGIRDHEGIWIGQVDHPVFCLNACANRKDSLGYMGCIDEKKSGIGCSVLNNTSLAAEIEFDRSDDPNLWPMEIVEALIGISAHRN